MARTTRHVVLALVSVLLHQTTSAQVPVEAYIDESGALVDGAGLPLESDADLNEEGAPLMQAAPVQPLPQQGQTDGNGVRFRQQTARPRKLQPLEPNSFQTFIHATTGRQLPLFGQAAFEQTLDFRPPRSASVPADYAVGPGDEIVLQITGIADQQLRLTVDRTGRIALPKVGTVSVVGVKAGALEAFLEKELQRSFRNFTLSASLGTLRNIEIYVVGQARLPGRHSVSALSSVVSAIMSTGGPNAHGSLRRVELVRTGATVATIDVYSFLMTGKTAEDVRLLPGDVLVFSPAGPRVALMGDVNVPAVFELKEPGEKLGELLGLVGGLPVTADRRATIERIDGTERHPRRVARILADEKGLNEPLQDGDVVTFQPISPAFANAVTLRGAVAMPLRHPYSEGMRVRDLIPDREALIQPDYYRRKNVLVQFDDSPPVKVKKGDPLPVPTPLKQQQPIDAETARRDVRSLIDEVNWDYAVVERLDKQTLSTRLLPFHLGKAVIQGDEHHNLALQPGDIVTVFGARDITVPQAKRTRLVRIEGEVMAPGVYQIEAGETLSSLVDRVGGTTQQAYIFGIALQRESVRAAQQRTLDEVIRQLEDDLRAHLAVRQSNLPASGDPAQMAAFQAQLQLEQRLATERLERLRSATPEGRIALELTPSDPTLPEVQLEDGDTVIVPALPSFVSILGAVHNENGLIWKEGRTVGEYLALAGTTMNADLDNIYVLRADGSVRSKDRGFWAWVPAQNHGLELEPGDVVIVPERMDLESGYTVVVRGLKDWTQILANMGIAVASVTLLFRQ